MLQNYDIELSQSPEFDQNHKKRKHSPEGSLERALFAAELEFPRMPVPRLPQYTSSAIIECAGKSEQPYSLCDQLLVAIMYSFYCSDIILFLIDYAWR